MAKESSGFVCGKSIRDETKDMLSKLPDKLILRILSFVVTKEVLRTSLLSQRWRFLWTHSSELHLIESSSDYAKISSFVDSVGNMLRICMGSQLRKLTIDFLFDSSFARNVNLWVWFVVENKVKKFTLICRPSNELLYVLPQIFYSSSSLTSLAIGSCSISPRGVIEWRSLKTLCLDSVELAETVISKIQSGCPVLKHLWLTACWGLSRFKIFSRSLIILEIDNWITSKSTNGPCLEISAPRVHVLQISGDREAVFNIEDISSCVRVSLLYKFEGHAIPDHTVFHMKQLIGSFNSIKELILGPSYIEVISMLVEKGWKLPHSDRLCLTLYAWSHKQSIPGILGILKSSPNLKTLVITGRRFAPHQIYVGRDQAASYLQNDNLNSDHLHLKTVTISGFTERDFDGEPMLTMVQLLLKRAKALEKIVIEAKDMNANGTSTYFAKIATELLGFPRSSPEAVVVIR